MSRRLIIAIEAERDIADAQNWYDEQRFGLGAEFIGAVEAMLDTIQQAPLRYQRVWKTYRRAGLHRFPYGLIYAVTDDEIIVLACIHGRRHPRAWRKRVE